MCPNARQLGNGNRVRQGRAFMHPNGLNDVKAERGSLSIPDRFAPIGQESLGIKDVGMLNDNDSVLLPSTRQGRLEKVLAETPASGNFPIKSTEHVRTNGTAGV